MSEEIRNEEVMEEATEIYDLEPVSEGEESGGNGAIKLIVGAVAVAGAVGALAWKGKDKIKQKRTEHQIKKLEKKGFVVTEVVADDDFEDDFDEEETLKEEKK